MQRAQKLGGVLTSSAVWPLKMYGCCEDPGQIVRGERGRGGERSHLGGR
eukprot:CAMPEP_0183350756 /NCGR_PEP_ID=MMETSP0164_2-20130417/20758_1 /TAXON_ID=221442 /ORGANISM="Coccolithus pelagicus ssp braarudi, Strain PLY182g" /LENGTH=48 /DNA_ID= /DNA_START= /DNA_END= /DNA_ORIENTATION=